MTSNAKVFANCMLPATISALNGSGVADGGFKLSSVLSLLLFVVMVLLSICSGS